MISYDIDPTLYASEPDTPQLDDGFSRPQHGEEAPGAVTTGREEAIEPLLSEKSDF